MSRVGFVGLGQMGLPIASRLVEAGHRVKGYDVNAAARATFAQRSGAIDAADAADAAGDAEAVILVLPTSAIVDQVLADVLAAMRPGTLLIDMGSSDPTASRGVAERSAAAGMRYVDAPVSGGGSSGARAGSLTIIVGGEAQDVAACMPLLEDLGTTIRHVGPAGAGHALKAINNLLSAITLLASSEALVLGRRFGLDPELMLEVINASSGRSDSTERKLPKYVVNGSFDSGGALALMVKDMHNATSLARQLDVSLPLGAFATTQWETAMEDLVPGADYTEIARWVADRSG